MSENKYTIAIDVYEEWERLALENKTESPFKSWCEENEYDCYTCEKNRECDVDVVCGTEECREMLKV